MTYVHKHIYNMRNLNKIYRALTALEKWLLYYRKHISFIMEHFMYVLCDFGYGITNDEQ